MRTAIIFAVCVIGALTTAAQDAPDPKAAAQKFSLQEAIDYSMQHNIKNQQSLLEIEKSKKQIAEVRAIGLPQIKGEAKIQKFLDIPTSRALANTFDPTAPEGELTEFQFGLEYSNSVGISANQVIFDGSYIVALQSASIFKQLSINNHEKTELELKQDVTQAYYTAMVARENMEVLQQSLESTTAILKETKALYNVGLTDEQSVDQLTLTVNELEVSIGIAEGQTEFAAKLLKLQMGLDINQDIELTGDLDAIIEAINPNPDPREFQVSEHIDYKIVETNLQLNQLTLRNEKFSYLPKLDLFFNHEQQNISNEFDFFSGGSYFPSTLLGASLKVPIWSSGSRASKVSQAKIELEKSELTAREVQQNLMYQAQVARSNYETNYAKYSNQKDNLDLAKKIYDKTLKKYKEGLASSLELAQAQNQYLNSEGQYIRALLDILTSRSELSKSYGTK